MTEVTLYFGSEPKKLPLRRNTARLRLAWQNLFTAQTSASREISAQSTKIEVEAIEIQGHLERIAEELKSKPTSELLLAQLKDIKQRQFDLVEKKRKFREEVDAISCVQMLEEVKIMIDSDSLTKEELQKFNSEPTSDFWQEQDMLEISQVIAFFRSIMGEGRQSDTGASN